MPIKRRKSGGLAPDRIEFLTVYRALALRGGSIVDACRQIGMPRSRYERWRERDPIFRGAAEQVKQEVGAAKASAHAAEQRAVEAAIPLEGLSPPLQLYIDTWRASQDRKLAWEKAGLTWAIVKKARAENPAFAAACLEVEEEMDIQAEDAQRRRAVQTGDTAAINSLKKSGAMAQLGNGKPKTPAATRAERMARVRAEKRSVN